jgi:hypothetical protein
MHGGERNVPSGRKSSLWYKMFSAVVWYIQNVSKIITEE